MTFDIDKSLRTSQKDVLIKLEQRYDLNDMTLFGSEYRIPCPFIAERVEENGVSRSFRYDAGYIYVTLSAAPNFFNNPVIAFRYIYITNTKEKYLDKDDPTGAITNEVEWKPILLSVPNIGQSSIDILDGSFSIDVSGFSCTKLDNDFDSGNDVFDKASGRTSFYLCECLIWYGVNGNYKYIFKAIIQGHSETNESIDFKLTTDAKALNSKNYVGDDRRYCITNKTQWPLLDDSQMDKTIPFYYKSQLTGQQYISETITFGSYTRTDKYYTPIWEDLPNAIPYDKNDPFGKFILGRFPSAPPSDLTIGFSNQTTTMPSDVSLGTAFTISAGDTYKLNIGTILYVKFSDDDFPTVEWPCRVIKLSGTRVIIDRSYNYGGSIISSIKRSAVTMIRESTGGLPHTYDLGSRDFTLTSTALPSGNYLWTVSGISWPGGSDQYRDNVYFIAYYDSYTTVGTAAKIFCNRAGISTNDSTFTALDTALSNRYYIKKIPFNFNSFPSVIESLEEIAKSNLCYYFFDKNGEMNVKSFNPDGLFSEDYTIDDSHIISNPNLSTEYQDIYDNIRDENNYLPRRLRLYNQTPSTRVQKLYNVKSDIEIEHCNNNYVPSWYHTYVGTKKNYWRFSVYFEFIEIEIGEIILVNSKYINNKNDTYLLVLGYRKSLSNVELTCLELFY